MLIEKIEENEDGSANYIFDVTDEEAKQLVPLGIQLGILLGITGLVFDDVVKICFAHVKDKEESEK
jgi:hypothetical protein